MAQPGTPSVGGLRFLARERGLSPKFLNKVPEGPSFDFQACSENQESGGFAELALRGTNAAQLSSSQLARQAFCRSGQICSAKAA